MNERIKELRDQATFYANKEFAATGSHELWTDLFGEKLAELIVQECFSKLTPYMDDQFIGDIESEIKEHFGIEE
jgi:hypothetical protein